MAFKKGDKNINRAGRPKKGQSFAEVLKEEAESMAGSTDLSMMQAIAKILWQKAGKGDLKAIDMLMDRIDGKPRQSIDHTTDGKEITAVVREIVDKKQEN